MSLLLDFIKDNKKPDFFEFQLSSRFVDKKGNPIMFKIKGDVPLEVEADIEKRCQIRDRKGKPTGEINNAKLLYEVITEFCIYPNFRDAKELEELGCTTSKEYINKLLTSMEIKKLYTKINELIGVGDIEENIEEAKN